MNYKNVTVFCAASDKCDKIYFEEARKLGDYLARSNKTIIYGGGKVGLMGALADASIKNGGKVIGVIPKFFDNIELGHKGINKMYVVNTLHEREEKLMKEADCIIALPGGIGTFSELLQSIVWKRLSLISADIFILNINNYFQPLIEQLRNSIKEKFLKKEFANLWYEFSDVEELIKYFEKEKILEFNNNNLV